MEKSCTRERIEEEEEEAAAAAAADAVAKTSGEQEQEGEVEKSADELDMLDITARDAEHTCWLSHPDGVSKMLYILLVLAADTSNIEQVARPAMRAFNAL